MVRAGQKGVFARNFIEQNMVAIGWGSIGDLKNITSREEIASLLAVHFPEYNKQQRIINAGQLFRFRASLVPGQTVVTYNPSNRTYHLGLVEGDYQYQPEMEEELQNTRVVRWTKVIDRDTLSAETKNSLGSIATIFCVSEEASEEICSGALLQPLSQERLVDVVEDAVGEPIAEVRKDTEQRALEFLQDRLSGLGWDGMQELVAGLLRAMGYKTRVSAVGPDQGRDIVASPDGFGFQPPRIIVEVKHRKGAMGAPEIRSFLGGLREGDRGLYVSMGGFTREAMYEAKRANHHLTLMDADEFASALIEHYDRMDMESRAILPLRKIYWPV